MKIPEGHGKELARFVKPGQVLHLLADGCIFVEIFHIAQHTASGGLYDGHTFNNKTLEHITETELAEVEETMKQSGYEREDEIFWRRE
jgi:hypothetical protein